MNDVIPMESNGSFRKKKGFTITQNSVARDCELSFKAKGLYLLIRSYITLETLDLSKVFLMSKCKEGEVAFENAWRELKEHGYLKIYLQPSKKGWISEYDLLDEQENGPHTFYLNKKGEITNTNVTRKRA